MQKNTRRTMLGGMAWLGVGMAAATLLLRVWLMPTLRDMETGLFATGWQVIVLMLVTLVALAVMGFTQRQYRLEIGSPAGQRIGVVTLVSGAVLIACALWDFIRWMTAGQGPAPQEAAVTTLGTAAMLLQMLFCLLGGVALVRFGLLLVSEGSTRRGMTGWSMLAPVMWMWFRLARYEMSYMSTVRLSESFFVFGMFILEMLFLFRLARYTSGVGKVSAGSLQFYAAATALFSLSAPLTRLVMYLLGDSEAYLSSELAGVPDVAVGLIAVAVAFGLVSAAAPQGEAGAEFPSDDDSADSGEDAGESFDFIIGE